MHPFRINTAYWLFFHETPQNQENATFYVFWFYIFVRWHFLVFKTTNYSGNPRLHFSYVIFSHCTWLLASSVIWKQKSLFFEHCGFDSAILFKYWNECQVFVTITWRTFLTFASHIFTRDMNENTLWCLNREVVIYRNQI